MIDGPWRISEQLMEPIIVKLGPSNRPEETERLHQEAVRNTAEILVGKIQLEEDQRQQLQKDQIQLQNQIQLHQQLQQQQQLGNVFNNGINDFYNGIQESQQLQEYQRQQLQEYQRQLQNNQSQLQDSQKRELAMMELSPVDLILQTMKWGNIAFNAPTSMKFDETPRIKLLLGIKQTIEELKQDIKVEIEKKHLSGDIDVARIKVAPLIMQALLEGSSFEIKPITPNEQPISSEVTTEWQWEIIPKSAGENILNLTLNAKLPIDGNSTYRTIRTFRKEIRVDVTGLEQTKNFIKDNWQWLWTAIFVPVGAFLWKKRDQS